MPEDRLNRIEVKIDGIVTKLTAMSEKAVEVRVKTDNNKTAIDSLWEAHRNCQQKQNDVITSTRANARIWNGVLALLAIGVAWFAGTK